MADAPLFSCLCVTEDRPAFMPWLLWNFEKQDYPRRELVVVDSSPDGPALPARDDITIVRCEPGTNVAAKRNLALGAASGELATWFDDDDWQHPSKLALLEAALRDRHALAGNQRAWFVDLAGGNAREHLWRSGLLFNSVGFRRSLAAGLAFDESRRRASDTPWVTALRRAAGGRAAVLRQPLFFWLCHEWNLSNPARRGRFAAPLATVRDAVGHGAWGDTSSRLEELRARLRSPPARRTRRPRVCVVVTTYNRPESLQRLLEDLEREWPVGEVDVRVYDDASTIPYDGIVARLRARGWSYVRAEENHGKRAWWRWWNRILADLRRTNADLYFVVQDDMRLCERFAERSTALWSSIADAGKASLFLHLDEHTVALGRSRWTPVADRRVGSLVRCGWVDPTAFLCERRFFDALDWRVDPIPRRRWEADPLLGSGVGAQLSVRLHRRGLRMYRVAESLTVHDDGPSLLNSKARRLSPMRTVRFVDGDEAARRLAQARPHVHASLASVPERQRALAVVVEALLPQVDRLALYLNRYPRVPRFLDDARIEVALSRESGDRGDAGKFFWTERTHGYALVCDDDIRYPPDYVARIVDGIERYGRHAAVGFHGAVLHDRVVDYYRSRRLLHFAAPLAADTSVHILGTGVAGYHTDALAVRAADFGSRNIADIWFALLGQRQRVPFVCLEREGGWLSAIPGLAPDSIYGRAMRRGGSPEATALVGGHAPWVLHRPKRPVPRPVRPAAQRRPAAEARGLGRIIRVPIEGPSRRAVIRLPEWDHITLAVQRSGTYYERDLLDAIREHAAPGTFADVGAHFGNHTLFFVLECHAEHVVAIEPTATSFDGLLANVRANAIEHRVTALHMAIHPTYRRVEPTPLPWRPRAGGAARTNSGMVGVTAGNGRGCVRAARLDDALASFGPITVLKVDAEGLGAQILESGTRILERDRPLVAVEAAAEGSLDRLRALLAPLGYSLAGRYCWTPTWLWAADRAAARRAS